MYQIPNSVVKASRDEIDEIELSIFQQVPKSNELSLVDNLPDDLSGYVFIAAPLPYSDDTEDGDESFVLNGDGMIYRLDFTGCQAKLKTKISKTPCYYADLAIQKQPNKYPSNFKFRNGGPSRRSQVLGSRNQLNTAFLKTNNQLFVTFDAARPYEIDPDTLEILEPVGNTNKWKEIFPLSDIFGAYSNPAHPVSDVMELKSQKAENYQEELFTINYSTGYKDRLRKPIQKILQWIKHQFNYRNPITKIIDSIRYGYATLIRYNLVTKDFSSWEMILPDGQTVSPDQSIHQMAITEDYIIFMDIAFKIEFAQIFSPFLRDRLAWIDKLNNPIVSIINTFRSSLFDKKHHKGAGTNILKFGTWIYSILLSLIPPEPYTNLYIVRRQSLSNKQENNLNSATIQQKSKKKIKVKKVTIPREVSHFTVDYKNPENKIILHVGHNNGSDVTEWVGKYDFSARKNKLRQELTGMIVGTMDLGCLGRYIIDAEAGVISNAKVISDPRFTWSLSVYTRRELCNESINETADIVKNIYWMSWGFSWETIPERIYRAYKDSRFRHIHYTQLPKDYKPTQLLRLDAEKMEIVDCFKFPYGHFACTPQFIPSSSPCPEDKDPSIHGYIVCVVLADNPENPNQPQDEFWILHADDFNNNPVYRLRAPSDNSSLNIGLTIHSTWLQEINKEKYTEDERRKKREISVYEDYRELIKDSNLQIKELFEEIIYPHFIQQTPEAVMSKIFAKQ
ncbi:carotenoid oxygenase family protein [Nostoc sp. CENA67]|uniref:Carotenoid oxygenase family protein n=1 Tax=Amazonocrinis nigriterrae CENA67 TaxID=2794033 RepID=A0A8J7HL30_9NOST|nr:carotenoid oxygenase family protein [Amazonocrinis nigriterrae]MBH8560715.1 carotenoid oxygenase family protein [Amazonocrinis nigriterrae CENA67]